VVAVNGQVRVLPKGATAFQPLLISMRVGEGADIVAPANSSAELRLPDGSTVLVSENTRFVVTKLDYDQQNRMRSSFFHLATGKLRAFVNKAASALVAARQANFAITTPTAVAAVRGTTVFASFDAATGTTRFFVEGGTAQINFGGRIITVSPGQLLQVSPNMPPAQAVPVQVAPATPGAPAPPVSPELVAIKDAMVANANPANTGTATVLGATAVQVTSAADVVNVVVNLPPVTTDTTGGVIQPPPTITVEPQPVTNPSCPECLPPTPSES
jgi:hypothetical protein